MQTSARETYLTNEVMTATPQRLQLMLIEGAIRFARQAEAHWSAQQDSHADEALTRAEQIVSELLCGLNPDGDAELVRRVASIYLFVFRTLTTAHLQRDEVKLNDAIRVLEVERETWRQVCDRLGSVNPDAAGLGVSSFVA